MHSWLYPLSATGIWHLSGVMEAFDRIKSAAGERSKRVQDRSGSRWLKIFPKKICNIMALGPSSLSGGSGMAFLFPEVPNDGWGGNSV